MRLVALVLALLLAAPAKAGPGCEPLAIFGTTCARCHEAECSDRLTLADPARAGDHVRRYTGALSDERVAERIALLRITQEQRRLDPAAAESFGTPPWDAARLARVHAVAERDPRRMNDDSCAPGEVGSRGRSSAAAPRPADSERGSRRRGPTSGEPHPCSTAPRRPPRGP